MSGIGERIKKIRIESRLSQEEFGKRIGTARNTVANYENGNRHPSNSVKLSICKEFNINIDWLLNGTGEMYNQPEEDEYTSIVVNIDKGDPKARQAIIAYWHLSPQDKELWWKFIERFIEKK